LDGGGFLRVFIAAGYPETVDSVFVYSMTWTDDSAVPVAHENIVAIFETV
jgi:hypothetical protein